MSENSHSECQCITDDEIDILFHNGERVVSGSITSHIGGRRYEVQAGDISKICSLAETLTEANNLFGNYFSIHVDLGSERKQVVQMERPYLTTIDGQLYRWEQVSDEEKGEIKSEPFAAAIKIRRALFQLLTAKGYDGMVYRNTVEGNADSYNIFRADQVRPATI